MTRSLFCLMVMVALCVPCVVWGSDADPDPFREASSPESLPDVAEYILDGSDETADHEALMEQLSDLMRDRVSLCREDLSGLARLFWLSSFQLGSIQDYIREHGSPVSVYELAYIPGFNSALAQSLVPFVALCTASGPPPVSSPEGRHRIVLGYQRVLEKQEGYRSPGASYLGSPDKWYLRYQYHRGTEFSFGFLAEKDPGEEFFKGSNGKGFDFYSGYGSWKPGGLVRSVVVGDFKADFGYGLVLSSARSLGKATLISSPARMPLGLRGYTSASEAAYFRGGGVVLGTDRFECSLFASFCHRDAIGVLPGGEEDPDRSDADEYAGFRSLVSSGSHATSNDLLHRGLVKELDAGMNISWQTEAFRVSATAFGFRYSMPVLPGEEPYQRFDFRGSADLSGSVSYAYAARNWLTFGECALSPSGARAILQGVQFRLGGAAHATVSWRSYDPSYHAPWGHSLSEGSSVSNERGWFLGCVFPLGKRWLVTTFTDFFSFPWMQSGVSAPSDGYEFFVRAECVFSRLSQVFFSVEGRKEEQGFEGFHRIAGRGHLFLATDAGSRSGFGCAL